MKKDLIFAPVLMVIAILLFLLKMTGMTAHIAISVVGVLVLAAYTVATKKTWKDPALEVAMRACYGIALIAGVLLMKFEGFAPLPILHKGCGALFLVLLVVLFVLKLKAAKKA